MTDPVGEATKPPWATDATFGKNIFVPIRVALAMSVIVSHSFPIVTGKNAVEPLDAAIGITIGEVAVNLFFAISGFLVTRSWERSTTTRSYLLKRMRRIYPAFIFMMIVQAFLLAPLVCAENFTGYAAKQLGLIAFNIVDLVGYGYPYGGLLTTFPNNPFPFAMNGSLWTIRYEFVCYLLLAIVGVILQRKYVCLACFFAIVSLSASCWILPGNRVLTAVVGDVTYWPRFLSFFLAGVTFYRFRNRMPHSKWLALIAATVLVASPVLGPQGLRLSLSVCGVYLLFWLAYCPLLGKLCWPNIGDPSYGIYLYGFPIQQSVVFWNGIESSMCPYRLMVTAIPLSLLAGLISWHAIEKRFLGLPARCSR